VQPESAAPTAPVGAACIDVGRDRGALVLRSDERHAGLEVEIYRAGLPENRTHVWVLPRLAPAGTVYAALFPSMPAGRYVVLRPDGSPLREVEVAAGSVTTADWM
jgi:hypothetical protein